ncbi:hypothetical protein AXG93_2318s1200 [Marchantia polymorpha subsp. ruderalis]|uniref:Uncharacterized protein n=1 Tax=Marchantia polymorpha subsp. ruderalis TaxID=1480154 RepID=A0A176VPN5_MARPO|nr:hypothetical protein AXG93_2318s1200 [Marchantia polymorpha subsp. ruderalis]
MDDYHEFGRDYAAEIDAWRRHSSPNYLYITQGGVATSEGASSSITEGTSGAVGATCTSSSNGTVSIAGGSTRGDASGVPSFSPIPEFFQRLRKNYEWVKTEKLRSLQEFKRKTGHKEPSARPPLPSFLSQSQRPSCWTCGDGHMRKDCPQEKGVQTSQARSQPAQMMCDHCGRASHPRESCFDLQPELRSRGRGRGDDAPRGRDGRGGRGTGAIERTASSATSVTESAMAARIEQLEQRLAAMAEPRGATVELNPQRGEGGHVPSTSVMRMATSVLRSPLFSTTELMDSGIDLARVVATSCEREKVTAMSAEIREDTVEDPSSTSTLFEETTWQVEATKMESLPARPAIDCKRIVPDIQTSLGGASDRSYFMTKESIAVQLRHDHPHDSSLFGVCAVVTSTESYDVLVDGAVLYLIGFRMDYWKETATYRPGWQSGDGCLSELLALQLKADRLVNKAWSEASLRVEAKRASADRLVCGSSTLSPLITTPVAWEYSSEGVCLLDLFGGISTGLAAVLQAAIRGYQKALPLDISLLGAQDLDRVGHIHMVQQTRSLAYIMKNVPLFIDTQAQLMASVHQVVRVADSSPMALVNGIGQPRTALPTLVSFPASHACRDGGPGLLWDSAIHQLIEPNADKRERAMGFMTCVTSSILEALRCQVLGLSYGSELLDVDCELGFGGATPFAR